MTCRLETASLLLEWTDAPWDGDVIGALAFQITCIEARDARAPLDFAAFERARDHAGARMVTCRLPHDRLRESMLLEQHGFRFIEMIHRPELLLSGTSARAATSGGRADIALAVRPAVEDDLPALLKIAGSAFHNERFHMDPRLGPMLGNARYRNWVRSALHHRSQRLFVLEDSGAAVAFFVTEELQGSVCHWHLTAVAPQAQGRGYGRRAWLTMIGQARDSGASLVRSHVAARNHRVMNLYAQLGFRFQAPSMTFHWLAWDGAQPAASATLPDRGGAP